MEVKGQIQKLLDDLNKGVYEKQEVIALALLTAIAGESIFLLGAPGVAKSLIARRLKFAFNDGTSFEYLMNRFSTPDEIFGPVSISQLKDHDKYERIIKNYLPSATVVFLDEIWKAGPSIQNALLTVLNEKVYRNGEQEIKVPMKALISASNELPMKGEGLEALWDRFLVRYVVDGITDKNNFNEMISKSLKSYDDNVEAKNKIGDSEYLKWSELIEAIEIPENVFNVIHIIRNYIQEHNKKDERKENQIYISDRRWKKIVRLLRTSAFLNDRKAVDLMDCFLIAHCIWNEPKQFAYVLRFTIDAVQKHGYKLSIDTTDIKSRISELKEEIREQTSRVKDTRKKILHVQSDEYYRIQNLDADYNLIKIADYDRLTNSKNGIYIYKAKSRDYYYNDHKHKYVRKGNSKFSIIVEDKEYDLKTVIDGEKTLTTYQPHKPSLYYWNAEFEKILNLTTKLKEELKQFQKTELKHIRVNLFVNPDNAAIVESHISQSYKSLEKIELDVKTIQNGYMALKNETKVLNEEFKD